jgi:hypothetical protein
MTPRQVQDMIQQALKERQGSGRSNPPAKETGTSTPHSGQSSSDGPLSPETVRHMIEQALGQQQNGSSSPSQTSAESASPASDQGGKDRQTVTPQMVEDMIAKALQQGQSDKRGSASTSGRAQKTASGLSRLKQLMNHNDTPGQPSSSNSNAHQSSSSADQSDAERTFAQTLTQAQYELSQELEENLMKLKSVIQQSQEIAKKIEMVLGQGNGSQQ